MITKIIINLTVFFIITSSGFSLPAILKVQLAETWFKIDDHYKKKQRQEFILGALFGDIYLIQKGCQEKKIDVAITLKEVFEEKDPFTAGELFSSYVEAKRMKILSNWGVEEKIPTLGFITPSFFLKLLEDELLFSPLLSSKASSYLSAISEKELASSFSVEKLAIWHGVMYKYFSQKPSNLVLTLSQDKRFLYNLSEQQSEILRGALLFYASQDKFKNYSKELVEEIEESFEIFKIKYFK